MSLLSLPTELLNAIFEPLAAASLAALATSCSSLTAVAYHQLYRHLSISSHARNLSALQSLANNPTLASLVRTFSISVHDSDASVQHNYVLLSRVLQDMTELTSLELLIGLDASWVLPIASTEPYHRLQHLTTSFIFDVNVAAFLSRTPQLLSLHLSSTFASSDRVELSPNAVPKLSSYTGPASLISVLFSSSSDHSSRPITTLHLSGDLTLSDIDHLALSERDQVGTDVRSGDDGCELGKPRIEVLSVITSTPPVIVLEALGKACPNLVCLRVMTTCAFWEAPDLSFYTKVANTLSSLRHLSSFELSGMHWESRPKPVTPDGSVIEKEWISPPVTPRVIEEDPVPQDYYAEFEESFMEWAY